MKNYDDLVIPLLSPSEQNRWRKSYHLFIALVNHFAERPSTNFVANGPCTSINTRS